jgi:beta-glucosidase
MRLHRSLAAVRFLSLLTAQAQMPDPAMELARQTLAKLTLEEKVSLCHGNSTMTINALPRVGLNEEFAMSDGPHNVRPDLDRRTFSQAGRKDDHSTSLPALSALAATWDVTLAARHGQVIGQEARARGKDMMLGPGVNIARTPLCGRNWEYLGEDPALAAALCVPMIRAIQSNGVAACVKHFALNNQELQRKSVDVEVDERTLREIYLPAFEAAVRQAGVLTVMSAYNQFRGDFCSHNDYLNNHILKGEWGFQGFVVTDWGGMHDTVQAALGGTDVEMNSGNAIRYFTEPLCDAVRSGKLPESVVADKALRVLYVMARLGKLGHAPRAAGTRNTQEHQQTARDIATAAIVLLKNSDNVLPLDPSGVKRVLVIGKNAVTKHCTLGGSAEGKPPYEITPLDGIRQRLGGSAEVTWSPFPGSDGEKNFAAIPESVLNTFDTTAKDAGIAIKAWRAEYFNNTSLEGAPAFSGFDRGLDFDWKQAAPRPGVHSNPFSARWTAKLIAPETGAYIFSIKCDDGARLLVDGKPVVESWKAGKPRTLTGEITLTAGTEYEVRAEFFKATGNATFALKWETPLDRSEALAALQERARLADAVLLITGNEHGHGQAMESEGADRPNLQLPAGHDQAIAALLPCNPRTVVVNLSGSPVAMPWRNEARAVVQTWFAGQEAGSALAAVLFGDANPSGKLPFTWPVKLADSPAHALNNYNGEKVNYAEGLLVGYRWFDKKGLEPLFPFGHGLAYTSFRYGSPKLSRTAFRPGETITVSVDLTNTGPRAGAEVVQLYVRDPQPKLEKAVRELKRFAKVLLQPGETQTITLPLAARDFAYFDAAGHQWKADAGGYVIEVGASSRDLRGTTRLELAETFTEPVKP